MTRVAVLANTPPRVPLNNDELKCTCNIQVRVSKKVFRCLCDTGAGRSLIRTSFAKTLLERDETRVACHPPQPLGRPLNCEGAEKGRVIGRIDHSVVIRLILEEPEEAEVPQATEEVRSAPLADLRRSKWGRGCHAVDVKFYMMDNLSDPMILGYPELSALGCFVEPPDDTGRRWLQFAHAGSGLRVPVLAPERKPTTSLTLVRSIHITGPNVSAAWLRLPAADYDRAVE